MTAETTPGKGGEQPNQFRIESGKYRARVLQLLGQPDVRRELVPQEFLEEFDRLHQKTTPITTTSARREIAMLERIDGKHPQITLPDSSMGNYLQGILASLGTYAHDTEFVYNNDRYPTDEERKTNTIRRIAELKGEQALITSGVTTQFPMEDPDFPRYIDGKIAGFEWALGIREDLGVDVQAEIDRFPNHPLRTPDKALS